MIRRGGTPAPQPGQRRLETSLYGVPYLPADIEAERPPTLHVVVDTEAEFDWDKPFAENLTAISALGQVESAQAIFDRYGLRPTYVIDYPVASQPESVAAIRGIADRGACAVGAHLHPWTNPPFGAAIDQAMSFPGNLPEPVEAAKLDALIGMIAAQFGERPVFYKAGRYGLGPNTAHLIAGPRHRRGFQPDAGNRHAGRARPGFPPDCRHSLCGAVAGSAGAADDSRRSGPALALVAAAGDGSTRKPRRCCMCAACWCERGCWSG